MASLHVFLNDISNVNKYIQARNEISQKKIITYYCAARCIQRHFRGYMTRQHLKTLHKAATDLKKNWKGKMSRRQCEQLQEARKAEDLLNAHHRNATVIQRMWRGYLSRKQKFDYYHYKEYIQKVDEINKKTLQDIQNYRMAQLQAEKDACQKEAALKRDIMLSTLHHVIRTKFTPGVFSLPDSSELSEIEKLIASFKIPKRKKVKPQKEEEEKGEFIQKIGKPFPGPFFPYEEVLRRKNLKPIKQE